MQYLERLAQYPILQKIGQVADKLGLESCVVGGFVRDLFLKRVSKDIDIVCIGDGITLAHAVADALGVNQSGVHFFKNFGTAMLKWQNLTFEFVGARKESYAIGSRKPMVVPGTLRDDQYRRDFTINALAIRLNNSTWGQLIDPFDGVSDIEKGIIKTPLAPVITFSDDPLRMLRAIRFASQLNFEIQEETLAAIKLNADRLKIVSQERITEELNKIIMTAVPSKGFRLLLETKLLHLFFPQFVNLQGAGKIGKHTHKDNFYHTLQVVDNIAKLSDNLWLRWAGVLHDIAKPATKKFSSLTGFSFHGHEELGAKWVPNIFRQLRLPLNEKMSYVQKLVRLHLRPIVLAQDGITDTAIRRLAYEAGDIIEDLLLLCRADVTSHNPVKVKQYLSNFDKVARKVKEVEERDHIRNFQPVITGEVIIKTFGLSPSPVIGVIKAAIKEAILLGTIRNEWEEAFQYMIHLAKEQGLRPLSEVNQSQGKGDTNSNCLNS